MEKGAWPLCLNACALGGQIAVAVLFLRIVRNANDHGEIPLPPVAASE